MVNDNPTWQAINDALAATAALPPRPDQVYLTAEQIAAIPRRTTVIPVGDLLGIPVVKVETVEESTPYRMMVEKAEREGYLVLPAGGSTIYAVKPNVAFGDR